MRLSFSLFILIILTIQSRILGNNNFFLPGDAFFPTAVNSQELEAIQKADPKENAFNYSNYGSYDIALCGYAGYSKAKFEALDKQFIEQLIVANNVIRNKLSDQAKPSEKKNAKQLNTQMLVMFYPASFDYPKYELGLQYNENWVEECVKFGHSSEHLRLGELVDNKDAIIESWKRSKEVGTFKFECFDPKKSPLAEENVEKPITFKGKIKAIVVQEAPLIDYLSGGDKKPDVLIVESNGVYQYVLDKESHEFIKTKVK